MYREYVTRADFSLQSREAYTASLSVAAHSTGVARQWCLTICPIVVGLLALYFFLWIGGVFALVGPLAILVIRMWATRRAEQGSASLELQGMS